MRFHFANGLVALRMSAVAQLRAYTGGLMPNSEVGNVAFPQPRLFGMFGATRKYNTVCGTGYRRHSAVAMQCARG